jgi:ATP-dependent helicase/nuclease subunit A
LDSQELFDMDRRSRAETLEVERSLLLQAPAGSGKTTVLTARFLALLATVDAPEQILAITFTRKAAAEMRQRIHAALRAASTGEAIAGIDAQLMHAAVQRDRRCGWQLLHNPARLRIQTIDALNHSLAAALPVAAGSSPALQINPAPAALYRRAARRALQGVTQERHHLVAAERLFEHLDNNWSRLESLLAEMLEQRSHWLPRLLDARVALAERVTQSLASLLRTQLARALTALPAALLQEVEPLLARSGQRMGLSSDPASLPCWRVLCDLLLTASSTWRRRFSHRDGFEACEPALKERAAHWIATLRVHPGAQAALLAVRALPDAQLSTEDRATLEALALLLTDAAAELQVVFAETGQVDYVYMAAAARQALSEQGEPSDMALQASGALRHLLIDEFQDVSFEQFELVRALNVGWERGDGRSLFIVGDPMQSIYQFREAEVSLFLRARDHGVGDIQLESVQLRQNFRSRAPLIAWINARIGQLFPDEDDARLAAVRYLPSVPAPGPIATQEAATLHRLDAGDPQAEAARVLQIVRDARARCPEASIAVLLASRRHAAPIVAQLRAAGYALRGVDLEPLRDRPVIRDLGALARALQHGADRSAWLALLRAPWCGLTLAELEQWLGAGQDDGAVFATLSLLAGGAVGTPEPAHAEARARIARVCSALEPALSGPERGRALWQRVERTWLRLGGPAVYPSAIDRLDAHRFIDALALHDDAESLIGDAMTRITEQLYSASPPQPGAIEIMTIHAAKGLEWDVVILPSLGRKTASDSDPLLHWIELPRALEGTDLLLAPIRSSEKEPVGSLAAYIKALRRERHRLERVRLLYVAATRARSALHLLAGLAAPAAGHAASPTPGSLLEILWPSLGSQFCALPSPTPDTAAARIALEAPSQLTAPPLRRLPATWSLPTTPAPPAAQRLPLSVRVTAETREYSWVGLTARAVGTIVHAEMQRLAAAPTLPEARAFEQGSNDYSSWLAELGVPSAERSAAQNRIREALVRTLSDPAGRWLLSNTHAEAHSEWRLTGLHEGRVVSVILDRMLIDAQGQRWVVDIKTSTHEGGALEQFLENEAQRYRPQLERYVALAARLGTEPVRAALYFPLLGALREASV